MYSSSTVALAGPAAKPKVVVLGSGWGGFAFAKALDKGKFDVTIVSPRNHMLFTPLLASTSVGTLDFRSIAEPVRTSIPDITFEQGKCRAVDPVNKTLDIVVHYGAVMGGTADAPDDFLLTKRHTMAYDALVVAVGARNNTFGIPGVSENVMFLKELSDARRIRTTIIRNIEASQFPSISPEDKARLLSFVVVGGGPTGVEFAAELHDFLRQDIRRLYPQVYPHVRVRLIEGRDILSSFDASLRDWAKRRLGSEGVEIITGVNVTSVDKTTVTLSDGRSYPFGLCVWSTGVAPRKITQLLEPSVFAKDSAGRLLTDGWLRVHAGTAATPGTVLEGVYAFGDCANVEGFVPLATAQQAEQSGNYLAKMMNDAGYVFPVPTHPPFLYKHQGSLAYVGEYGAVSDFTQVPGRGTEASNSMSVMAGKTVRGVVSWFLWRSAYLTKLGSWRNRLQVPMDWLRTLLFGRDITNF